MKSRAIIAGAVVAGMAYEQLHGHPKKHIPEEEGAPAPCTIFINGMAAATTSAQVIQPLLFSMSARTE